jgi:hypothetical protein
MVIIPSIIQSMWRHAGGILRSIKLTSGECKVPFQVHQLVSEFLGLVPLMLCLVQWVISRLFPNVEWLMRLEIPIIRTRSRGIACKIEHKNSSRIFVYRSTLSVKISVYWDTKLCSPAKVNRCFGEIYRLHYQGRAHAGNKYVSHIKYNRASLTLWL